MIVAIFPTLWLGLFSDDPDVFRVGGLYLHVVAPTYLCFGMGLGLFFVSQGLGRGAAAAGANAVRLAVNVVGGTRRSRRWSPRRPGAPRPDRGSTPPMPTRALRVGAV